MNNAFEYINRNTDRFVQELQEVCRQPSVSAQQIGMQEMAQMVADVMCGVGIAAKIIPVAGGFPMIYGELRGETDRTILFYNHYDVQPPEPLDEWLSDPFAAKIRDGALYARGAADNKGSLLSRIHAVEAILETAGTLPATVKFLVEGEEEIGSPHLELFVKSNKQLLLADACVWEHSAWDEYGNPTMSLGNKGMCSVELVLEGTNTDLHSMFAPIYVNAAWELSWALATLKNHKEEILIEGFYDDVDEISADEEEVLRAIPGDEETLKRRAGLEGLLLDQTKEEAIKRLYTAPTCNICGIRAGYIGEGMKTILPARAIARLDLRLVLSQDPEDILTKLRRHLDREGFGNIEIRRLGWFRPSKTPVTSEFVEIVRRAAEQACDRQIVVLPTSPASGPRYVFSDWTPMPIVGLGVGHSGSRAHAPNENIRLEDYRQGTRHIAALIQEYAEETGP